MSREHAANQRRFLIIDDLADMRSALRSQLGTLGYNDVALADGVRSALEHLAQGSFDVILCDYYLGSGADGQQFLEHLRGQRMLPRATLFIMITAEKAYSAVVTAAESLPDDYLIKPFTADTLRVRLQHLLEKKARLLRIDSLQDKGRWTEVIAECDLLIASGDRFKADAMRIRGQALLACGRNDEALEFYRKVLDVRPLPWARLGLARAQQGLERLDECHGTLLQLIEEAPQLLAAYDLLSRVELARGEADAALRTLDKACEVSPDSLSRLRAIAAVAETQADYERVKTSLHRVLKRTQFSPLRDTGDVAQLSSAYVETGEPEVAIALIEDARKVFKADARSPQLAAMEALAHHKAGRPEQAAAALAVALEAAPQDLPPDAALRVAQACLATGRPDEGETILKNLIQGNPGAATLHTKATALVKNYISPERAATLVDECSAEIVTLNNEAVRLGKEGHYDAAARMLSEAAKRLPDNPQIVANAAAALLADVYNTGLDADKLRRALELQQRLQTLAPEHPRHKVLGELQSRIRTRYAQPG
jgi:tetratricopeptide (TPR) repeat protein